MPWLRSPRARARLLDAAKGHMLGGAGYTLMPTMPYSAPRPRGKCAHVAAVEMAGQPDSVLLAASMAFLLGLELEDRGKRAKGFLGGAQHVGAGIGHHRGLEELAEPRMETLPPSPQPPCTVASVHMALHFPERCFFSAAGPGSRHLQSRCLLCGRHLGGKLLHKRVITPLLHIEAVGAHRSGPHLRYLLAKALRRRCRCRRR